MKHLLALSLLFAVIGCSGRDGNRPLGGAPESVIYSYNGTMAFPIEYYRIERDPSGEVRLAWSRAEPEITVIKVPEDALEQIGRIVESHSLHRLKSSYRPPRFVRILDGNSWSFKAVRGERSIYGGGYHSHPSGRLYKGISSVVDYLRSLVDASSPEDVTGTESHL